jgi:hypothetical protein
VGVMTEAVSEKLQLHCKRLFGDLSLITIIWPKKPRFIEFIGPSSAHVLPHDAL